MKAVLVFLDGTICDTRHRHALLGRPEFYAAEAILQDQPVSGSTACLHDLACDYAIVYIGARPVETMAATQAWLAQEGYPPGPVYLGEDQAGRLACVRGLATQYDFLAGIGDRWDDNELHLELGCLSLMVCEYEGAWDGMAERLRQAHRRQKVHENRLHLAGKVEGLARVCPLLLETYGDRLWESYFSAVMAMAERTRPQRREEELALFARYSLDPSSLVDAARLEDILRQADWANNPVYGLQSFEHVEATPDRWVHKVTACAYAELWRARGLAEIGYQIHCRTDQAWWDRPAYRPEVRFAQPVTLMQGDPYCLFVQSVAH